MSKKTLTHQQILHHALLMSSRVGLSGLTIGSLAKECGLSKSGVFSHFKSKEKLQLEVIQFASERFHENVIAPALLAPRGLPRLRMFFVRWIDWLNNDLIPDGCPMISAAAEIKAHAADVAGSILQMQDRLFVFISKATDLAKQEGHLCESVSTEQFAFQFHAIVVGYNLYNKLVERDKAESMALAGFEHLVSS